MLVTALYIIFGLTLPTITQAEPVAIASLPTPQVIMNMDAFTRADWCRKLTLTDDEKALRTRLLTPLGNKSVETVRNHLEMKGYKLPSTTGYFHPPRAKISIREVRRESHKKPSVLNTLLGAPKYADEQKTGIIGEFIIRGCIIEAVGRQPLPYLAQLLHEAAFSKGTIIFRTQIIKILQKSGPIINLYFVPWADRLYNRERHPKKYFMSRFAKYILNSSIAGNPRMALQSAPLALKLKLLALYTKHHEATAIAPILTLCNAPDKELRMEARKYMVRYFQGPPTKARVGTIKLPGGVEKTAVLYLGSRQQAYHAVKKALEEATHGDYDRTTSSTKLASQLFAAWDRIRHAKWDIIFTKAYRQYKEGFINEAVTMYRKVLANGPNDRQKELMFPAFMVLARQALFAKKMGKAIRYIRILSQLAASPALEADLYYLLGLSEEATGDTVQAIHWYKLAVSKNPHHVWSVAAYHAISPLPLKPVEDWEKSTFMGLILLGLMLAGVYLIFRWSPP